MRKGIPLLLALVVLLLAPGWVAGDHVPADELHQVLPRDGIRAVRNPTFTAENYLPDQDLVVGIAIGGDARAYPIRILNHHEIVNDRVGGVPVAVTVCPLCNWAVVFDRRVGDSVLTFGVSGFLFKSNLVMYDRETESLWVQITAEAIRGPLHGTVLESVPATVIEWGGWRDLYPNSLLLDYPRPQCPPGPLEEPIIAGSCTDYTRNPYVFFAITERVYFGANYSDLILHPKTVVLGITVGGVATAYPYPTLLERGVINDVVNGLPIVAAFYQISGKVFERGQRTFAPAAGRLMVDETGRSWDMVTGESEGERLREVPSKIAFWFAWAQFYEASGVYGLRAPPESEAPFPLLTVILLSALLPAASYTTYERWRRWRRRERG